MARTVRSVMKGETARYKQRVRASVSASTCAEIEALSVRILEALPGDARVGSLQSAMMLAAIAYTEYGERAIRRLVSETKAARAAGGGLT